MESFGRGNLRSNAASDGSEGSDRARDGLPFRSLCQVGAASSKRLASRFLRTRAGSQIRPFIAM